VGILSALKSIATGEHTRYSISDKSLKDIKAYNTYYRGGTLRRMMKEVVKPLHGNRI
jgi:hypothetical protein